MMCLPSWRGDPHKSHAVRGETLMYRYMPTYPRVFVSHNRLSWLFDAPHEAEGDAIRLELVERVRGEIAEGTYETPEKWEAAFAALVRDVE
jgi:hypothetical protein